MAFAERGRFWRMSVNVGDDRDVAVHSERQSCTVTPTNDGMLLGYDELTTAGGQVLPIRLEIEVIADGEHLSFHATGQSDGIAEIREISLPVIELAPNPNSHREALYRSEGLGRRVERPRSTLGRAHTEYMRDDALGVWEQCAYPGEMSMAWHGVEFEETFLYVAKHDSSFRGALFGAGIPSRDSETELWLAITTATDRHAIDTGVAVVAALPGNWRSGARKYQEWAKSEWYDGPARSSRPRLEGWQRIIMKHQFGGIQFTYEQLVDVFEQGRRRGLDGILLFGWWRGGFDRGYPTYEPDEALGGSEALMRAIDTINARGGFISLYANGNLIDRTTPYFAAHAAEVSKKDSRGLDFVAGYDFAQESLTARYFAAPSFVPACHAAPRWRAEMAGVARQQSELGAQSVFFDQTGFHLIAWPCFDSTHEHGTHTNTESIYRAETLRAIRAAAGGASVGSEGMADNLIPVLDFHHGCGFAFQEQPEAFPGLFRTVFPEPIVSNRFIHDERADWAEQLNYALVYNLAFDVAIHRSRRTIDDYPSYAGRVEYLVAQRRAHKKVFDEGAFELITQGDITHTRYSTGDQQVDVYWNRSDQSAVLDDGTTLAPEDVVILPGIR